ncbi:Hypothetical predicted protein [Mytilus galloprovincialis]|uniref:Integrase catalytic domain-containing protein n=1 Tax=Mytilus galloprovincialis TaxID=29158 RepID=A0A8B6GH46_MYTGA|nr:Hypothetical predicted protein [Mytilus galloprovincialis]
MERVALDIIGPLPISYKNNKYALIVTDYFTKWVEGFPMPDMETTTIVDNLVNHFFCRFGIPCQMHSDQGRQFESGLFKELCAKLKIDKTRTTSFRPQSNGLVERYNRTLENTISKYISKNQRDWDEQLPWALMAYNSSEHETTKFSPSMLMLGREIQLPVDLIYGPHPQEIEYPDETVSHNDYVKNMQEGIWKVSAKARQNISKNSDKNVNGFLLLSLWCSVQPKKLTNILRRCSADFALSVPTSKRFRLIEHEKNVHRHILNPRTNNRELVIPETPTRNPVPTSNFNTRQSCTVTRPREVTPPTTPILTRSIKPISPLSEISPCSISLGIEDYSSVSPVKKNLVDLFDSPTRQAVEEPREETKTTRTIHSYYYFEG